MPKGIEARASKAVKKSAPKVTPKPQTSNPSKSTGSIVLDLAKGYSAFKEKAKENSSPVVKNPLQKTITDAAASIKDKGQEFLKTAVEIQLGKEIRGAVPPTPLSAQMTEYINKNIDLKKLAAENKTELKQGGVDMPLVELSPEGDDTKRNYLEKYLNQRGGQDVDLNSLTLMGPNSQNFFKQDRIRYAPDEIFLKRLNGLINETTSNETKKRFESILLNKGGSDGAGEIKAFEKNLGNAIVSEYDSILTPEERQKTIDGILDLYNKKHLEKGKDFTEFAGESVADEIASAGLAPVFGGLKKMQSKFGPPEEWPKYIKEMFNKQKKINQTSKELIVW